MSVGSFIRFAYWTHLSKPPEDRLIYRTAGKIRPKSIVDLGIGDGVRTRRMLALCSQWAEAAPEGKIAYTGVDLFEGRPAGQVGLSLKEAHRDLAMPHLSVRLAPGDPLAALSRLANSLANTDLLIVNGGHDAQRLGQAWRFVPRMLHGQSVVLEQRQEGEKLTYRHIALPEIEARAAEASGRGSRKAA